MRLSKIWLVARYEIIYNLSRRSYLLAAFGLPFFIGLMSFGVIQVSIAAETGIDDLATIGVVDETGLVGGPYGGDFSRYQGFDSEDAARAAFVDGTIAGYFVVPSDYPVTASVSYFSDASLPAELESDFLQLLRAQLAEQLAGNAQTDRLQDPLSLQLRFVGDADPISAEAAIFRVALPIMFAFIIVFNTITSGQFIVSGISEEKETRIIEVLMTSLRPTEFLTGKALGLSILTLLQFSFWAAIGLVVGLATNRLDILNEAQVDPFLMLLGVVYFVLMMLLFAGIMIGIGSITSAETEARQFAGVFILLTVLPPSWGVGLFLEDPTNPLVTFMSLFPLTSPASGLILLGIGEAQPWQIVGGLLILLLCIGGVFWFAGRIFRAGMLNAGQRLSFKQIARLLRG